MKGKISVVSAITRLNDYEVLIGRGESRGKLYFTWRIIFLRRSEKVLLNFLRQEITITCRVKRSKN